MTKYPVCDHPELFIKDNLCHWCLQLDGQLSIYDLEEINEKA